LELAYPELFISGAFPVRNMKFLYTYVLQSRRDSMWYTGYSKDLRKRIIEHNKGLVYGTSKRRPFDLIYYEACGDERDAKMREQYLKSGPGKRYIKNRLKFFFANTDISNGAAPINI
jgi:putative endonuclease